MWRQIEKNNLKYYILPQWRDLGADVYISCRVGGVSQGGCSSLNLARHVGDDPEAVTENRCRFFQALGVDGNTFVSLQQTHSSNICRVSAEDWGKGLDSYDTAIADTDAMYTTDESVFMATFYADCLPVALFDPVEKVLALAHAGWRGTYQNIVGAVLQTMVKACGTLPENILAAFGPGIGQCCYEVDGDFYRRFTEAYAQAHKWFKPGNNEKYFFNNSQANKYLLAAAGVRPENIEDFPLCTSCNENLFYSYRASGGKCGRHGLFGSLTKVK